jgi:hypothetical protein
METDLWFCGFSGGDPEKEGDLDILLVRGDPVQLPYQCHNSAFVGTQLWSKKGRGKEAETAGFRS